MNVWEITKKLLNFAKAGVSVSDTGTQDIGGVRDTACADFAEVKGV